MLIIQEGFKSFLVYWFTLTLIPGIINDTNQPLDFAIASLGFVVIIYIIPLILGFLKFDPRNDSTYLLVGSIITTAYTFVLKPGLLGLLYFPQTTIIGDSNPASTLRFELNEFGIIVVVGILSLLLNLFLEKKFK